MVDFPRLRFEKAKERVRSALLTTGFSFPPGRITVNLSPADLPKEGGRFDLPIAVGILAASGQLPRRALARREFYGELALGGEPAGNLNSLIKPASTEFAAAINSRRPRARHGSGQGLDVSRSSPPNASSP